MFVSRIVMRFSSGNGLLHVLVGFLFFCAAVTYLLSRSVPIRLFANRNAFVRFVRQLVRSVFLQLIVFGVRRIFHGMTPAKVAFSDNSVNSILLEQDEDFGAITHNTNWSITRACKKPEKSTSFPA